MSVRQRNTLVWSYRSTHFSMKLPNSFIVSARGICITFYSFTLTIAKTFNSICFYKQEHLWLTSCCEYPSISRTNKLVILDKSLAFHRVYLNCKIVIILIWFWKYITWSVGDLDRLNVKLKLIYILKITFYNNWKSFWKGFLDLQPAN